MPNTAHNTSRVRALHLWTVVRDGLRTRRRELAQSRTLRRDLASYTTRSQVDDLLAAFEGEQGPEFDAIRGILASNLQQQRRTLPFAS